jgi:hypothetical protein
VAVDGHSSLEVYTVMKIDTATGETWQLASTKDANGHLTQQWLKATP